MEGYKCPHTIFSVEESGPFCIYTTITIHFDQYKKTMSSSQVNLESYLIPLEEIIRATGNFSPERRIGNGGFGEVFKGKLSKRWQNRTVAVKRLGQGSYQGDPEFRNELEMISKFHHENIISFIGYCDQGKERIIVYEYASNGSLDQHLQDPNKRRGINWTQRLKICQGAARGLHYLHSGLGETNRVIHRDVKSANILLDDNFVAKICDFGLSKLGPKNQPDTRLYTKVAGTPFYVDPRYHESGILSKESDVYSFGVVLFEMLSGMLVYLPWSIGDDKAQLLMNFVRRYEHKNEDKLIDYDIREQVDSGCFDTFKEIAYQCVTLDFKNRPAMDTIIEKIDEALKIQENVDALIECVREDIGFSDGKPVAGLAAFTIYKCLLCLKYFEAEKTSVFDRLIHLFISAIEDQDSTTHMAYWLSNASTLLFLIHASLNFDSASPPTSLLKRMTKGYLSSVSSTDLNEVLQPVKAKQLTLHFKQQLTSCVEKMYVIIRDNLKKEVGSLLALCIRATFVQAIALDMTCVQKKTLILGGYDPNHWHGIVGHLNTFLNTLEGNNVPPIIVHKIFAQIFSYINVQLFNSLLLHKDCCTFNNGEYVKAGLAELEKWCLDEAKEEYAGSAWWDELKHIRQASEFLVIYENNDYKITDYLYPILSKEQVNRIGSLYWNMISYQEIITTSTEQLNRIGSLYWDMISNQEIITTSTPFLVFNQQGPHSNIDQDSSILLQDSSSTLFEDGKESSLTYCTSFSVDDLFASLQVMDFTNIKPIKPMYA